jgi:quercetin dioxygenase-like cupin family protein
MSEFTIVRDGRREGSRGNTGARFASANFRARWSVADAIDVACWVDAYEHPAGATAFVLVAERAIVTVAHGAYPLARGSYAVLPDAAHIEGGSGVVITTAHHRGFFMVGGPVEAGGRLRYIDGCTDSVLVAPIRRGDPCVNLLHLPPGTTQSDHIHPSVRVGLIVAGQGRCVLSGGDEVEALEPHTIFVLAPNTVHRFETDPHDGLLLMAWHPDSDIGPTDDDHPMLNRTLFADGIATESRRRRA